MLEDDELEDIYGYCSYCKDPIKRSSVLVQMGDNMYHKFCFEQCFAFGVEDE